MFSENNIMQFAESEVAKFIDTEQLPTFKPKIEPLRGLMSGEDIRPNKLPMGGGGGTYDGGGSASAPSFGDSSFDLPNFEEKEDKEKEAELETEEEAKEDKFAKEETGAQLVNVTYGHRDNGKQSYSYYATNKRTGDIVTPYVTHWRSGKLYKTLAVVKSTHKIDRAQDIVDSLHGRGIFIKTIGATSQKTLPNYYRGWGNK